MRYILKTLLETIKKKGSSYRWSHPFHLVVYKDTRTFFLHRHDQLGAPFNVLKIDPVVIKNWLEERIRTDENE